jgi:glyoxylase-like metal-dependent hydrolase (beta-lactamase superfamily II)
MKLNVLQIGGVAYDSTIYYLDTEKPILIDTGTGFHNKTTIEKLGEIKSTEKLSKIVLTHNHADHSGGAKELMDEFNVPLYAQPADAKPLKEGDGATTGAAMFGFDQPKLEINDLNDDDVVDCGDVQLTVIHTPGHSPGSITLYDPESKSIFCGDLAFMDGGVGRWDLPGGDYKTLVKSYKKVLELEIENFYPGHGPFNEGEAKKYLQLSYRYLKSCESFA